MLLLTIPSFFPIINGLDVGIHHDRAAIWLGVMVLMVEGFGMLE